MNGQQQLIPLLLPAQTWVGPQGGFWIDCWCSSISNCCSCCFISSIIVVCWKKLYVLELDQLLNQLTQQAALSFLLLAHEPAAMELLLVIMGQQVLR